MPSRLRTLMGLLDTKRTTQSLSRRIMAGGGAHERSNLIRRALVVIVLHFFHFWGRRGSLELLRSLFILFFQHFCHQCYIFTLLKGQSRKELAFCNLSNWYFCIAGLRIMPPEGKLDVNCRSQKIR